MADTRLKDAAQQYLNKRGPTSVSRAEVNMPMAWNYCEAVQDSNPVYWDEEFAKKTRFGGLICPPQMLKVMAGGHWWAPDYVRERQQKAIESQGEDYVGKVRALSDEMGYSINTQVGTEGEFLAPIKPGDGHLLMTSLVTEVTEEKQTRVGRGVFITSVVEYRTEKDNKLVGRTKMVLLKYIPGTGRQT